MIYCEDCGYELIDFEIEENKKNDSTESCWECHRKYKSNFYTDEHGILIDKRGE